VKSWLLAFLGFLAGVLALVHFWPQLWPLRAGAVWAKRYRYPWEEKIYHGDDECQFGRMISWPIRFASWQDAEQAGYRGCRVCQPSRSFSPAV
jgi:hypothetical protein